MQTEEAEFRIKNENEELNRQKITRQSAGFNIRSCSSHLEISNWSWARAGMSEPEFVSCVYSIQLLSEEWLFSPAFCVQEGNDLLGGHTLNINVFLASSGITVLSTPNSSVGFATLKRSSEDETVDVYCLCK